MQRMALAVCGIWTLIAVIWMPAKKGQSGAAIVKLLNGDSKDNLSNGKMIIVYFWPDCDACEHEARYFADHRNLLSTYHVYFISDAPTKKLIGFSRKQQIDKVIGFEVLHDQDDEIKERFHIRQYPTILFFSAERALVGRLEGETSFSKILPLLQP